VIDPCKYAEDSFQDYSACNDKKRNSGPAFNLQAGFLAFRTYDINLLARVKYHVVANDNFDHGPMIDVGVIYHNSDKGKADNSSSSGLWWKVLLGLFLVSAIAGNS
jgi:hypothetical protein